MNAKIFFFFFGTMINKWNLSRETTQMAFPIFIPDQKAPPGQGAKGLTSLLIKIGKNLLCRIFLNIGEWTSHLQTVIFPATREFHKLTRNRACLVIAQRPQLSHHVKSMCLWSENCKCFRGNPGPGCVARRRPDWQLGSPACPACRTSHTKSRFFVTLRHPAWKEKG